MGYRDLLMTCLHRRGVVIRVGTRSLVEIVVFPFRRTHQDRKRASVEDCQQATLWREEIGTKRTRARFYRAAFNGSYHVVRVLYA
jgi:hypothetical protein